MKFYFCEKCGKRLTEADVERGAAKDKKLKGVFCTECAVGVLTMEMQPLSKEDAKKILNPAANPPAGNSKRAAAHHDAASQASPRMGRAHAGAPHTETSSQGTILMIVAAALLLTLAGGWLLLGRHAETKPEFASAQAANQQPAMVPAKSAPALSTTAPPASEPREAQTSALPAAPGGELPTPAGESSPESLAQSAFDELIKFQGLAADDKKGCVERIDAFLEKHGQAIVAARAQILKKELTAPVPTPGPVPELPPVSAPTPTPTPMPTPAPDPAPAAVAQPAMPANPEKLPSEKESLILHWKFDESVGSTATDASGHGNAGTLKKGANWIAEGKIARALFLDGLSGSVETGPLKGLNPGNTPHSIAVWIKMASEPAASRYWILVLGIGGTGAHHWLFRKGDTSQFGSWDIITLSPEVPVGQWRHVATTFDGTTLKAYSNGAPAGSCAARFNLRGVSLALSTPYLRQEPFKGALDDLRIYNRALTDAEVAALAANDGSGKKK